MKNNVLISLKLTIACLVLCSGLYTLALLGIARLSPDKGNAATIDVHGRRQYLNVAQAFPSDGYFQPRPSAVGYNAAGSGGSNKGPTNAEYIAQVKDRIDTFLVHNPTVDRKQVPVELVTASGSGLDPDLSPKAALVQSARVAQHRHLDVATVERLVHAHTTAPFLGLFGPPKVNVLQLNIALDAHTVE